MCKYCEKKEYQIRISVDKWNKDKKAWEPENKFEVEYCPMCRKEAGRVTKKEYSIYKGEKEIFVGTIEEVMEYFGVKRKTVYFWASPANIKRADTGNRPGRKPRKKERSGVKVAIRLWKEDSYDK